MIDFFQFASDVDVDFGLVLFGSELCPHAGCGFVALLCLFKRRKINFCPLRFLQKCGAETRDKNLYISCTRILVDMEISLKFIETIHECLSIEEGKIDEELKTVEEKLIKSKRQAGLLCYWTDKDSHCVTVYVTPPGTKMVIEDNKYHRKYIKNLPTVRKLALLVLSPDNNDDPQIVTEWKGECDAEKCKEEFLQLPVTRNFSSQHQKSNLEV